jgi:hypothetical protein
MVTVSAPASDSAMPTWPEWVILEFSTMATRMEIRRLLAGDAEKA